MGKPDLRRLSGAKLRIKQLEKKVKACDDLFLSFLDCIQAVGDSDKVFKKSLDKLQKNLDKYKSL